MEPEYVLPFPENMKVMITKPKDIYAHENYPEIEHAIDFFLPSGTHAKAARGGKVVKIKSDSDKYGLDVSLAEEANFVVIAHGDGTYAEYVHLGKDTVTVEVGDQIRTGDHLGDVGYSGCMNVAHIHFNAFKIENDKLISIYTNLNKLYLD